MTRVESISIQKINNSVVRLNESLKDIVVNYFLFVWCFIKIKIIEVKNGKSEPNPEKMSLVFGDEFTFFDKNKWRIGQPWGLFHPESPYQYYGEDTVCIEDDHLVLGQRFNPKKLSPFDSEVVYDIPYSVGLITSHQSFGYGLYQFEVKLPKGAGLWPAVWLSCVDSWPPEIDINESYSDKRGNYKNKLQSNFHFNFGKEKTSSGARNHFVFNDKRIIKMSCWWTPQFIKIYYNGYLVRQITSKRTLKWFTDKKMIIILNNAIRPEFVDELKDQSSKFHIFSVKYWQ